MTFFAKNAGTAEWHADRLHVGRGAASSSGKVGAFRERVAADQPPDGAVRHRPTTDAAPARRWRRRRALPDLPADQGRRLLGPPAGGHLRPAPCSTTCPSCCREPCATRTTWSTRARASTGSTRPDDYGQVDRAPSGASASRRRWSPSSCWRRRRRRACASSAPRPATGGAAALLGGLRRPAALRAHRRASARSARRSRPTSRSPTR